MNHSKTTLSILLVLLGVFYHGIANAERRICLSTASSENYKGEDFAKLVETEVARHVSHVVAKDRCTGVLRVELLTVGKVDVLTIQLNNEVPVRYRISDRTELLEKLEEGISLVLQNDPETLMADISRYTASKKMAHSVTVAGENLFGFEIYQSMIRTGKSQSAMAPGAAATVARGVDTWKMLVRLQFGGWPEEPSSTQPVLQLDVGIDIGMNYEFLKEANVSPYLGFGAGLRYFRLEAKRADTGEEEMSDEIMPVLLGRAGLRLFRYYDFNMDVFVSGLLPCIPSGGGGVAFSEKQFTPILQAGIGAAF